jgi:hypothetical protein
VVTSLEAIQAAYLEAAIVENLDTIGTMLGLLKVARRLPISSQGMAFVWVDALDGLLNMLGGIDRPAEIRARRLEESGRILVEDATVVSMSPAPDGTKLAIRYFGPAHIDHSSAEQWGRFDRTARDESSKAERIAVIDDQGKPMVDFAVRYLPDREWWPRAKRIALIDDQGKLMAYLAIEDPRIRDESDESQRYIAACTALLLGSGGPPPDDAERAKQRRQALEWLKADLDLRKRQLESGTPEARAGILQVVRHLRIDRDLAGVRDPERLAKLPGEEQTAWRSYWAEVDVLERKARGYQP